MNNRTLHIAVWIGFLCLVGACINPIELEIPSEDFESNIVVNGLLTEGNGPFEIQIVQTGPPGSGKFEAAPVASAWVEDGEGNTQQLLNRGEGNFLFIPLIVKPEIGVTYRLRFELLDGTEYASEPETMLPVADLDSVHNNVRFEDRINENGALLFRNFLDVFCDVNLDVPNASPYMRWEVERWWMIVEPPCLFCIPKSCYIQEGPVTPGILLFDGRQVDQDFWRNQYLGYVEVDWKFNFKSYFNIYQYSLTKAAFDYWQQVDQVVNQTGSIFDVPPAAIRGNVSNLNDRFELVLGYFGVSAADTIHYALYRQEVSNSIQYICDLPIRDQIYGGDPCDDCLVIPGAITERPDYW